MVYGLWFMVYGLWFMVYGFEKPAHKLNKNDILTKWPAIVFKTRILGWVGLGHLRSRLCPLYIVLSIYSYFRSIYVRFFIKKSNKGRISLVYDPHQIVIREGGPMVDRV